MDHQLKEVRQKVQVSRFLHDRLHIPSVNYQNLPISCPTSPEREQMTLSSMPLKEQRDFIFKRGKFKAEVPTSKLWQHGQTVTIGSGSKTLATTGLKSYSNVKICQSQTGRFNESQKAQIKMSNMRLRSHRPQIRKFNGPVLNNSI